MANHLCRLDDIDISEAIDTRRLQNLFDFRGGGRGAGDHTTARVVFRDMFDNRVRNRNLGEIFGQEGELDAIYDEIRDLPGFQLYQEAIELGNPRQLNPQHIQAITNRVQQLEHAIYRSRTIVMSSQRITRDLNNQLREHLTHLIDLRNILPYSAMFRGGTGGAEGRAAELMRRVNQGENESRNQIIRASLDLLDARRMRTEFNNIRGDIRNPNLEGGSLSLEERLQADMDNIPGLPNLFNIRENISENAAVEALDRTEEMIIQQHLMSLASAYPNLRNDIVDDNFLAEFRNEYNRLE